MSHIAIDFDDYQKAKEGSLLIKRGSSFVPITFEELNKENAEKLSKYGDLEARFSALSRESKHFVKYALSHFLVVFNYFKIKILSGEIDETDEEILRLDEAVLNGEIKVEEAIEKHPFIKEVFEKLYLKESEMIEFPEV